MADLANVLHFVLQHSDLPHDSFYSICALLCTSHSIRDATTQHCGGRVHVGCVHVGYPERAQQLCHFMAAQGHLLSSLSLALPQPHGIMPFELDIVAAAAVQANAAATEVAAGAMFKHVTGLQHLELVPFCPIMLVLSGNYCSRLTSLCLTSHGNGGRQQLEAAELLLHQTAAALGQLTALRQLVLWPTPICDCFDPVLVGTSSLTHLTRLSVRAAAVQDPSLLQHLPASLLELDLSVMPEADGVLDLGHLTRLSHLSPAIDDDRLVITHEDVLPPCLEVLDATNCLSVMPLLGLHNLRELTLGMATCHGEELAALSSLQALSKVSLRHTSWADGALRSALAWGQLPLAALSLHCERTPEGSVLQNLCKATGLTALRVSCLPHVWDDVVDQLSCILHHLTALRALHMTSRGSQAAADGAGRVLFFPPSSAELPSHESGYSWCNLAGSIVALPHLERLELRSLPIRGLAGADVGHRWSHAVPHAVSPHVTMLDLSNTEDAATLLCLVPCFPGVRQLMLDGNACVTDAVLAAVAQHMRSLERLSLCNSSGFTQAGMQQLSSLPRLRQLPALLNAF